MPKNKKIKRNRSRNTRVNVSGPLAKKSNLARRKSLSRKSFAVVERTIVTVIVLAIMVVVLAVLSTFFLKPENLVKKKIEDIAADYYENYYYDKMMSYAPADKSLEEIMTKYVDDGFTSVPLKQLTLFDSRKHADAEAVLFKYCDPEKTWIQVYPEAPFEKSDYRVEYNYACVF